MHQSVWFVNIFHRSCILCQSCFSLQLHFPMRLAKHLQFCVLVFQMTSYIGDPPSSPQFVSRPSSTASSPASSLSPSPDRHRFVHRRSHRQLSPSSPESDNEGSDKGEKKYLNTVVSKEQFVCMRVRSNFGSVKLQWLEHPYCTMKTSSCLIHLCRMDTSTETLWMDPFTM